MPPAAASVCEYALLTVPLGKPGAVVMVSADAIASVNDFVAKPEALSSTRTVKPEFPELAGVPLMTPVAGFSVRPLGNDPRVMDHVYGEVPPTATKV